MGTDFLWYLPTPGDGRDLTTGAFHDARRGNRHRAPELHTESVGQHCMQALLTAKPNNVRELEIYPNLWAGVGLVRGGAGTAIVGSHEQVAERIAEYEAIGIDTFIMSAYPNLEEAVRVGEDLLPLVQRRTAPPRELPLAAAS